MNWNELNKIEQLETVKTESTDQPIMLFKHSTRCSISSMAKSRLERAWNFEEAQIKPYYLDLIANRDISNAIAEQFGIQHESPQILLIKNGECVYNASHSMITANSLADFA